MLALTAGLVLRFFSQVKMALKSDKHDRELRDLHALLASMYPAYSVGLYTGFDPECYRLMDLCGHGL